MCAFFLTFGSKILNFVVNLALLINAQLTSPRYADPCKPKQERPDAETGRPRRKERVMTKTTADFREPIGLDAESGNEGGAMSQSKVGPQKDPQGNGEVERVEEVDAKTFDETAHEE